MSMLNSYFTGDLVPKSSQWTPKLVSKLNELLKESASPVDWDAIADSLGHDKSAMECFMMYRNQTCPSINRGAWTAEEVQRLTILAEKYDCHEWPLVATELGTDRTPLACLEYFQRHLNSARMTNSAGFSTEEDEVLRDAARFYAHPCHLYASSCLQTRLPQQCCDRLRKLQPQTEPHIDHVGSSPDTLGDDCASTFLAEEAEARRARFERSGSTYRRPSGVVATTTWTRREEKLLFLAALAHRMPMNADNKRPAVDIERLAALPAADVVSIRALVEGAGACGSAPGASASTSDTSSATATTDTGSAEVRGRKRKAATAVSVGAPAAKVRSAAAKSWAPVAALVPGRTEVQCREKWGNTLDPTLNLSLEYSPEEDAALLKLLPVIGVGHWARLSQWFVGRTDAQLMKRYRFLLDRAAGAETVVADAASVTVGHLSSNRMGRIKKH